MKKVAIVDYGMGNLRSVTQAAIHAAADMKIKVVVAQTAHEIRNADRVVLPGQGAMRDCMQELQQSGMQEAIQEALHSKPLLGICVGMQMLLDHSDEQDTPGLGFFAGRVHRFELDQLLQNDGSHYKIPHIGWNRVFLPKAIETTPHPVWGDAPSGSYFYFVHSYFTKPERTDHVACETDYGGIFCSAIAKENVFATQFHPEKSDRQGLRLFHNFLNWDPT